MKPWKFCLWVFVARCARVAIMKGWQQPILSSCPLQSNSCPCLQHMHLKLCYVSLKPRHDSESSLMSCLDHLIRIRLIPMAVGKSWLHGLLCFCYTLSMKISFWLHHIHQKYHYFLSFCTFVDFPPSVIDTKSTFYCEEFYKGR